MILTFNYLFFYGETAKGVIFYDCPKLRFDPHNAELLN